MPTDLDKLQGTWHITSFESDGRKMPARDFEGSTIVIKGNEFTSVGMGATYEGTVELDPTRKPKTIDLLFAVGHAAGVRNLGIYKLDRSRWTICLATRGNTRPVKFAAKAGGGLALETLERGVARRRTTKPTARPKQTADRPTKSVDVEPHVAPSGAATDLEGEWTMVAGVFNGAVMGQDMVKWCQRITRSNITSVVAGPQVMLKARFTLDRSRTPHAIDYVNLQGTNAGKSQAGIFELDGEALRICMAAPGQPRPREFLSKSGDRRSFTTWRLTRR